MKSKICAIAAVQDAVSQIFKTQTENLVKQNIWLPCEGTTQLIHYKEEVEKQIQHMLHN